MLLHWTRNYLLNKLKNNKKSFKDKDQVKINKDNHLLVIVKTETIQSVTENKPTKQIKFRKC